MATPSCSNEDQVVPEVDQKNANRRIHKKPPPDVQRCITAIHKAFLTTFKHSTSENFRQEFLGTLKVKDQTQAFPKLSEYLWQLTERVYGINQCCEKAGTEEAACETGHFPSTSKSGAQESTEMNAMNSEISESLFFDGISLVQGTSNVSVQTTMIQHDWFEDLLFEDSDSE